jgi:hypothetical protein
MVRDSGFLASGDSVRAGDLADVFAGSADGVADGYWSDADPEGCEDGRGLVFGDALSGRGDLAQGGHGVFLLCHTTSMAHMFGQHNWPNWLTYANSVGILRT